MTQSDARLERPRAIDAVNEAGSAAWDRVMWMMFKGPHASVVNWGWWGLILLVSGAAGYGSGGSGSNFGGDEGDFSGVAGWAAAWIPLIIAPAICLGIVIGLVWLYVRSRFRLVAIDGVMSGEPRIRDAWARSSSVGMQYFVFEVLVAFACLVIALPVLLSALPILFSATSGEDPNIAWIALPVMTGLLILVPLAIAKALLDWFVYDVTLPLAWLTENDFWTGLRRSFSVLGEHLGAVLLFLLARFLIGIVGGIVFGLAACLTCVLWIWPAGAAVGLLVVSISFPPLFLLTIPLAIVLFFAAAWIVTTVGSPIFLFYRSWSIAFVGRLVPDVPRFEPPEPAPAPAPPAPPAPAPPAAPSAPAPPDAPGAPGTPGGGAPHRPSGDGPGAGGTGADGSGQGAGPPS